jgi:hypothetical protein
MVIADLVGLSGSTYGSHHCSVDNKHNATTLACSYFNSGIRVFDIRDPNRRKEVAYYNPAGTTTRSESGSFRFQGQRLEPWKSEGTEETEHWAQQKHDYRRYGQQEKHENGVEDDPVPRFANVLSVVLGLRALRVNTRRCLWLWNLRRIEPMLTQNSADTLFPD